MKWDPALLQIIAVAAIALLAFICVSVLAWPATKAMWREFKSIFKRRPPPEAVKTRMPAIPRPECVQGYELVFNLLRFVAMQKIRLEKELAALGENERGARRRLERAKAEALENFSGLRDAAARFLATRPDEELGAIASFMSRSPEYGDGLVSPEECAVFLRQERQLLASQPYMAASHLDRLNGGLGKLIEERRNAADAVRPPDPA